MGYLHTHKGDRFTLTLRVSRWHYWCVVGSGVVAVTCTMVISGWEQYLWGTAGVFAIVGGVIGVVFIGVLRMGPRGVAAWYKWHWDWIAWDDLVRAGIVRSADDRKFDQLVLHVRDGSAIEFPGLETPHKIATKEGSVQWAADFVNTIIAARQGQRQPR